MISTNEDVVLLASTDQDAGQQFFKFTSSLLNTSCGLPVLNNETHDESLINKCTNMQSLIDSVQAFCSLRTFQ